MPTNFFQIVFLFVRMLLAGEAVKFIQFDIFRVDTGDDLLSGGLGLDAGALNPAPDSGRMYSFDQGNGLGPKPFETLLGSALDFLFRGLEVIKGRAVTLRKGHQAEAMEAIVTLLLAAMSLIGD